MRSFGVHVPCVCVCVCMCFVSEFMHLGDVERMYCGYKRATVASEEIEIEKK